MSTDRRLLVIATTPLCIDGLTKVLLNIAGIAGEFFSVEFSLGEGCEPGIREKMSRIGTVHDMPSRKNSPIHYLFALKKLIRENGVRTVHIHGNSATMALDLLAAKMGGATERITHCHNQADQPWLKKMTLGKLMNRLVTHPVACSQASGKALYAKPFQIIRNGIEIDRFCYSEAGRQRVREKMSLQDAFVIGHIGRFSEQKNHKRLINIFSKVLRIESDAILMLCGTGELYNDVLNYVSELGLQDSVLFCGAVDNPEDYLMAMDVFCLPSLFEGLPLVGVEAQTSGLPCVFSDSITHEAAICPNCRFVSLDATDEEWAEAICTLGKQSSDGHKERIDAAKLVRTAGYDDEDVRIQARALYSGL